jgi:hypothetical protein
MTTEIWRNIQFRKTISQHMQVMIMYYYIWSTTEPKLLFIIQSWLERMCVVQMFRESYQSQFTWYTINSIITGNNGSQTKPVHLARIGSYLLHHVSNDRRVGLHVWLKFRWCRCSWPYWRDLADPYFSVFFLESLISYCRGSHQHTDILIFIIDNDIGMIGMREKITKMPKNHSSSFLLIRWAEGENWVQCRADHAWSAMTCCTCM